MVYDSDRQVLVLWGGSSADSLPNDTWEYDGNGWHQIATPVSPPGRTFYSMAYDALRQVVVVCCGVSEEDLRSDTWEYNGTTWQQGANINGGIETSLVYDPTRRGLLFFVPSSWGGETGLYDGEVWRRLTDTLTAESGIDHLFRPQMVYDSRRQVVVLQSIRGVTFELHGDKWQRGAEWESENKGRSGFGLAYDIARGVTVLFGGLQRERDENLEFVEQVLNDTWEYDGEQWIHVTPEQFPPARYGHAMAYDEARQVIVLFGGIDATGSPLNDTWEYDGDGWVQK
jgi:hypothetical protein